MYIIFPNIQARYFLFLVPGIMLYGDRHSLKEEPSNKNDEEW